MPVLLQNQVEHGYFKEIGGFPDAPIVHELREYNGSGQACIACTQLNGKEVNRLFPDVKTYSPQEKRRIAAEWIEFLSCNPRTFRASHFNSQVPPRLFQAICCQEALEELRIKWGTYSDLSALEKLRNIKFLYLGPGASVQDLAPLKRLENLIVLHLGGFRKVEDYSALTSLQKLEQLAIHGPILGNTQIKNLEFLKEMPNLRSVSLVNVRIKKHYSPEELEKLHTLMPDLYDINSCIWGNGPHDTNE